jgi:hypothetical protein
MLITPALFDCFNVKNHRVVFSTSRRSLLMVVKPLQVNLVDNKVDDHFDQ